MPKRGWRWDKANSRLVLYVNDTEVGRFEDGELGFHGATAANKAEAYTQTYSTADRTVAAPTAEAPGDLVATEGGWGASSEVNFDKIHDTLDKLVADNLDLRQVVTALIDDLQEIGLVG